jgi:hypothetical protein
LVIIHTLSQCRGPVTFGYESGSAYPWYI